MTDFSKQEFSRYTRHIQLSDFGVNGQRKLKAARVLIVGCGGLGAPVSLYLAGAGVGHITLVDGDNVELSNLQRQVIFSEADIGQSKSFCAQARLQQLNSHITIEAINKSLGTDNAAELIAAADLVIDCTDNFAVRYLINDLCKAHNKAWLYASVYRFSGQCSLFTPHQSCFRCVFPQPPTHAPDCNSNGVLGVLPGILGTIQATEAIKYLTDLPSGISNTLLLVEADDMQLQKVQLRKEKNCPVCHDGFVFNPTSPDYQILCDTTKVIDVSTTLPAKDFNDWQKRNDVVVVDVRDYDEHLAFNLGGLHIPLNELKERIKELPTDKLILLYCQSGVRSAAAALQLQSAELSALSVSGGIAQIISL